MRIARESTHEIAIIEKNFIVIPHAVHLKYLEFKKNCAQCLFEFPFDIYQQILYICICKSLTDKQKMQIGGFDIASALVDLHLWWFLLSYMKASD